jgi:hypothetical protein
MKKPSSAAKLAANCLNGRKGTGPKNTSVTRFNAVTHGLLVAGITELDDAEGYHDILRDLKQEKNPVGVLEKSLVESMALDIIRGRRARRLEGEYITSVLHPPIKKGDPASEFLELFGGTVIDPGSPALMQHEHVQKLVTVFQRYESIFVQRLFRDLHELERLQRMRNGEAVQVPAVLDVTVHTDPGGADSFAESTDKTALGGVLSEPPDKREDIDSKTAADESQAATSPDLNDEAGARGLPTFPELSESRPPGRGEDLNSQVSPENDEGGRDGTDDE